MRKSLMTAVAITAMIVSGCTGEASAGDDVKIPKVEAKPTAQRDIGNRGHVMMSIQHLDRLEADKKDDEIRKADKVLEFTGIWPGMTVLEMEAGKGYYTELMSRVVGPKGSVIMQNPWAFDAFITAEDWAMRMGADGKRLANVRLSKTDFDALDAPDNSVDVVTWFLGPHELFFTMEDGTTLGEAGKSYAEIFRVLKPGGHFIVLDHAANAGDPESTGGTLHRIDPAAVRTRAEHAGLVFTDASKVLGNPGDDHTANVFAPEMRRKTDRFLHKYTKPKH